MDRAYSTPLGRAVRPYLHMHMVIQYPAMGPGRRAISRNHESRVESRHKYNRHCKHLLKVAANPNVSLPSLSKRCPHRTPNSNSCLQKSFIVPPLLVYHISRHQIVIASKCFRIVHDDPRSTRNLHPTFANTRSTSIKGVYRTAIFNAVDAPYLDLLKSTDTIPTSPQKKQ
ncbi:hypothetical protein JVT61DRAFT_9966 [Boletus reticuloceps]|uniref:Uncharacterized protein n=1 Tax=Boletus reticuloceps TaxID=495285 RepID=A0A8I2YW36_9AGAM|nr:hypothetical protein JVT61DRAFT_9966 [Boletus reticuloceps]